MRYKSEEFDYIYAICDQCGKTKKIPRKHVKRIYYGYKMEKLAKCSCGAILTKIDGHDKEEPCVSCGKDVSINLLKCPYCGKENPHVKPKEKKDLKKIVPWIPVIVVAIGIIFALIFGLKGSKSVYITDQTGITQNGTVGIREEDPEVPEDLVEEIESQENKDSEVERKEGFLLYDSEGIFLGKLSTNVEDEDSIFNDDGAFGSITSTKSIWNKGSIYGGSKTNQSAFYEKASDPPQMFLNGEFWGYLSKNTFKTPRIAPENLWNWLLEEGY